MHHMDPHLADEGNGSHVWTDAIGKSRAKKVGMEREVEQMQGKLTSTLKRRLKNYRLGNAGPRREEFRRRSAEHEES